MNLKRIARGLMNAASERAPELLVGIGVASLLTAIGLAIKATPIAEDLITQAERQDCHRCWSGRCVYRRWNEGKIQSSRRTRSGLCIVPKRHQAHG